MFFDKSVKEIEDLRDVLVHRQDRDFVSEPFFAINKEGVAVFAESIGYAGRTIEPLVEKADTGVKHDLVSGAMEEHGRGGRHPVFEAAVVREDGAGKSHDAGVLKGSRQSIGDRFRVAFEKIR